MENEPPKGFQVRDRRRFTESGEVRAESEESTASNEESTAAPPRDQPPPQTAEDVPLEITLSTFVMSLSTQALLCLGEIPNPATGQTETDLTAVRELIDILSMLQEKTRGNVDPAEAHLFEKVLFDLRMRFVEKARK